MTAGIRIFLFPRCHPRPSAREAARGEGDPTGIAAYRISPPNSRLNRDIAREIACEWDNLVPLPSRKQMLALAGDDNGNLATNRGAPPANL